MNLIIKSKPQWNSLHGIDCFRLEVIDRQQEYFIFIFDVVLRDFGRFFKRASEFEYRQVLDKNLGKIKAVIVKKINAGGVGAIYLTPGDFIP